MTLILLLERSTTSQMDSYTASEEAHPIAINKEIPLEAEPRLAGEAAMALQLGVVS